MEINFSRYRPSIINIELNRMEKFVVYKYFLKKEEFDKILEIIPKKDITIENLKYFLYNLKYIHEDEVSSWIYKIKIKSFEKKSTELLYCYYYVYITYYKNKNMENIYNAVTKLGKKTFKYMELQKERNSFTDSFQQIFYQGKNISFFNFLFEEFKKRISLKRFIFFEEYFIKYNSILTEDLMRKYTKENSKDKNAMENFEILENKIKQIEKLNNKTFYNENK